ncbi:hypothetical protein IGI04_012253 [Brassica rapa subsp. trilocularis]|uniref:B box-type domain-containing protein n=2 Tax=Brassica TaxID=3705 RepID=A0ABQ8E1Q0_BRANA|nr:hypothetical protein IGI04_012253 [Brassica rapa subsp. trilocularis]KAH0934596.1 hypothetical protein HID58_011713 [Brassica napus]
MSNNNNLGEKEQLRRSLICRTVCKKTSEPSKCGVCGTTDVLLYCDAHRDFFCFECDRWEHNFDNNIWAWRHVRRMMCSVPTKLPQAVFEINATFSDSEDDEEND